MYSKNLTNEKDFTKFSSFEEKFSEVLNKLKEDDIFEVHLNADGILRADGARGKEEFGVMTSQSAMLGMKILATLLSTTLAPESPDLECELPIYGHRFAGTIPPVDKAPTFTIRKKASKLYTLDDLVEQGVMALEAKRILEDAIKQKLNILVVGGTKSGKTTFCNAMLHQMSQIDPTTRVIIIEDSAELQCSISDKLQWEVPQFMVGNIPHKATMDYLLKKAMRRSPSRIILGEIRGKEAQTLLMAWNSGHPGGCTTIHADNAENALVKLEQYIELAGVRPNPRLISSIIDYVVSIQQVTLRDEKGKYSARRVEEIISVDGYISETNRYDTSPLYIYEHNFEEKRYE